MPTKYIVSVGENARRTGTFYWNVMNAERVVLFARKGFRTRKDAIAGLEEFRHDVCKRHIENPITHEKCS
jgi:hypothetical protein